VSAFAEGRAISSDLSTAGRGWVAQRKISAALVEEKNPLVERDNKTIAVARQCELLGLSRSSYYYRFVMINIILS